MFIWSDMVFTQVCKNTDFKWNSCCSVKHESLRRNFHNYRITPCIYHFSKILVNGKGFRCGILCRNHFITDNSFNGSDKTNLVTHTFQNRFHHVCCGCFSFCSCNSDNFQLICRISKICCRCECQCISGILYFNNRHMFRCLYFFFHNNCNGSFFDYI